MTLLSAIPFVYPPGVTRSWYALSGMIPGTSATTPTPVGAPSPKLRPTDRDRIEPQRVRHLVEPGVARPLSARRASTRPVARRPCGSATSARRAGSRPPQLTVLCGVKLLLSSAANMLSVLKVEPGL
jgi:hypothetical protein